MNAARALEIALAVFDNLPAAERSSWVRSRRTSSAVEHETPLPDLVRRRTKSGGRRVVNHVRRGRLDADTQDALLTLVRFGLPAIEIAMRLGVSDRTVQRYQARKDIAS